MSNVKQSIMPQLNGFSEIFENIHNRHRELINNSFSGIKETIKLINDVNRAVIENMPRILGTIRLIQESMRMFMEQINRMLKDAVSINIVLPQLHYWESINFTLPNKEFFINSQPNAPPLPIYDDVISDINVTYFDYRYVMILVIVTLVWSYFVNNPNHANKAFSFVIETWNRFKTPIVVLAYRVRDAIFDTEVGNFWNKITRKDTE